uniref:TonB-dependent receptor plug domain-containing protein n=1 Tax=uncultured Dysgonomonas sp. TaxID=206096 RepID=UPI002582BB4E|nr:TonB-dependent receptor plug domain-containing protein [uncultured Dysgonomonas sp.]
MRFLLFAMVFIVTGGVYAQNDSVKNVNLNEVSVTSASKSKIIEQQAIKTTVVDVKSVSVQTANLSELLNRTVGLRVRQTGGLGSSVNLMMNGFEGKAIKYFKDGIPMDYLGSAFSFSLVPINQIDRIEVYKGVLPTALGADALGGGVNIVTRQDGSPRNLDMSYQYGSFNTHRISLRTSVTDASGKYFIGGDFFYNHSDNDYKVSVPIVDSETAISHREKLPLFHNSFSNVYGELFGGIRNQRWADELRFGLTYFNIDRDNNYGVTMDTPFGKVTSGAHSVVPTLRYQKKLFDNRLKFDQFLVYNTLHSNYTDTVKGVYDWYGNFTSVPSRNGEATNDGSLTKLQYENFISRTNASYRFHPSHEAELNIVYSQITRTGSNPFGDTYPQSGEDVLSTPAKYEKLILALGLKSFFMEGKLTNNLLLKYFSAKGKGYSGSYGSAEEGWDKQSTDRFGIGEALKYSFSNYSFVRLSAESTVRLPEQSDFFGDGSFIEANFLLKPERSYNINLGAYYSTPSSFTADLNLFYRRTYDLILLINTGVTGKYQNVNKVKGLGMEFDASYTFFRRLKINGNFTYQDFRLFGQSDAAYEGARLRNTPYFFANLGANIFFNNVLRKQDQLSVYWNYGFVREYYLNYIPKEYEPDGFLGLWGKPGVNVDALIIPDQNLHSIGCTWQLNRAGTLALSFEMKNIFDAAIYDNYRIQNAGRSAHVKISFAIN